MEEAVEHITSKANKPNSNLEDLKKFILEKDQRIALPDQECITLFYVKEISHCTAESNYTNVFLENGEKYVVSKTLKHYDDLLNEQGFFRVHKSCLVNLQKIKKVMRDGTIHMQDGTLLSVSQRIKKDFMTLFEKMG